MLAGRAAEEIVYGADEIGGGAGGPSRSSDLAVATRLAELIVCRSGLGGDGALHWTRSRPPLRRNRSTRCSERRTAASSPASMTHRELLEHIVEILVEKQELSGRELRGLLREEQRGQRRRARPSTTRRMRRDCRWQ